MDKRKKYFLIIDTETAGTIEKPIIFDIGGAIIDKKGNLYSTFSFIVEDVFYEQPSLMKNCYYVNKLPQYKKDITCGKRIVRRYYEIKKYIASLCADWNVQAVIAHNAAFDYRATVATQKLTTSGKYKTFLPYDLPVWDTLKMARDTICKQKSYLRYCAENDFLCKNGTPRATAEILYKYITGNMNFSESHTALEDVLIEKEIFAHCIRQHKRMRKNLWSN